MSENSESKELNIFSRIALFYRQVINELRKVVWPSRNMLTTYTGSSSCLRGLCYRSCFNL